MAIVWLQQDWTETETEAETETEDWTEPGSPPESQLDPSPLRSTQLSICQGRRIA